MGIFDEVCADCKQKFKRRDGGSVRSKATHVIYSGITEFQQAEGKIFGSDDLCAACTEIWNRKVEKAREFPLTTTASFEDKHIIAYKGIATGEVYIGVGLFKDYIAGFRDVVGGRSKSIEKMLKQAREMLLRDMVWDAMARGANAIVGIRIDFENLGSEGGVALMLLGTGTAVETDFRYCGKGLSVSPTPQDTKNGDTLDLSSEEIAEVRDVMARLEEGQVVVIHPKSRMIKRVHGTGRDRLTGGWIVIDTSRIGA